MDRNMTPPETPATAATAVAAATNPVGLLAVGVAAPAYRLPISEARAAWGEGGGKGQVAVCGSDEDALTLAWEAADSALGELGDRSAVASEVGRALVGHLATTVRRGPEPLVSLFCTRSRRVRRRGPVERFSARRDGGALRRMGRRRRRAHAGRALVIVSDALVPGLGTASETTYGAGAVAIVLGPAEGAPAVLRERATRSVPVLDRYRADGAVAGGDPYDPRLFREEVYLPVMSDCRQSRRRVRIGCQLPWRQLSWRKNSGRPPGRSPTQTASSHRCSPSVSVHLHPFRFPFRPSSVTPAPPPLCSGSSLRSQKPAPSAQSVTGEEGPQRSRSRSTTRSPARKVRATGSLNGHPISYIGPPARAGLIEAMTDPVPMGLPPGGAAFVRGNPEMLGLAAPAAGPARTISTPPSVHPHCIGCGGDDSCSCRSLRHGTVHTYVVNQTMPPPFVAPLPLLVLDLDDGARLMVQGPPDEAPHRDRRRVELALRRYALERGGPVYGFKASGGTRRRAPDELGPRRRRRRRA